MSELSIRSVPLELKQSADSNGRFAGYASVFHVVDSHQDSILPGAFAASLSKPLQQIRLLWQHSNDLPIGRIVTLFEDRNGLFVEAIIEPDTAQGRDALALLQRGEVRGLSIGFIPIRYRFDTQRGTRVIEAIDLHEISLVTYPANRAANVTVVRCETAQTQLMSSLQRAAHSLTSLTKPSTKRN